MKTVIEILAILSMAGIVIMIQEDGRTRRVKINHLESEVIALKAQNARLVKRVALCNTIIDEFPVDARDRNNIPAGRTSK